jgi:hypothetical protein
VVEFVDEFGTYSVGAWTAEAVEALKDPPPPNCGACCHPPSHEERTSYTVIGRIKNGRVGERPLTDWLPYVVMPGKEPLP